MINDYTKNNIYNTCEFINKGGKNSLLGSIIFGYFLGMNIVVFLITNIYFLYALIILIDILLVSLILLFVFYMRRYKSGKLKFDKSIYNRPNVGEEMVCINKFYYDELLCKTYKFSKYSIKFNKYLEECSVIDINETFIIQKVVEYNKDWSILMRNTKNNRLYSIYYLESNDILKTKSEIRKNKLKKLKIGH